MPLFLQVGASCNKDISRDTLLLEIQVKLVETLAPYILGMLPRLSTSFPEAGSSGGGRRVGKFILSDHFWLLVHSCGQWCQFVGHHWPSYHLCDSHRTNNSSPVTLLSSPTKGRVWESCTERSSRGLCGRSPQSLSGVLTSTHVVRKPLQVGKEPPKGAR